MEKMAFTEVAEAIKRESVVLFPIGTVEAHGPHLPLSTDTLGSLAIAELVRRKLKEEAIEAIIAPPSAFGCNALLDAFPGTISIRPETLKSLIVDVCQSLHDQGFRAIFLLNHHNDPPHVAAVEAAAREASRENGLRVCFVLLVPRPLMDKARVKREGHVIVEPEPDAAATALKTKMLDCHAGERETSMILRYFPQHLRSEYRKLNAKGMDLDVFLRGGRTTREALPLGYFGDPAQATAETGNTLYEARAETIKRAIMHYLARD